jgi:uncharacterized protein
MSRSAGSRKLSCCLTAWFLAAAGQVVAEGCEPGYVDIRDSDAILRFQVEVADTAEERARGLMERETMPQFTGMLFVYPEEGPVSFWMRNTLMPLDMLFFDGTGRLANVRENAVPLDETPIPGGESIRYVLEINGGLAESLGIEQGAELRSPALDEDTAVWRCE